MNDFASAISVALHQDAKEIAMSVDMQQAENTLRENMRAQKRRKVWTTAATAAAAAAVVLVAGGLVLARSTTSQAPPITTPTSKAPSTTVTYPLDASQMTPAVTAQLPYWVATADAFANGPGGFTASTNCDAPSGLCADGKDRRIDISSAKHVYPLDGSKTIDPTYAQYVKAWTDVQRLGYGKVTDVATTTVGGRPATTMAVVVTQQMDGLAGCEQATTAKNSGGCFGQVPGRTLHLAIVDQGTGQPPTLISEGLNTTNTRDAQAVADEFATWLATVRFS